MRELLVSSELSSRDGTVLVVGCQVKRQGESQHKSSEYTPSPAGSYQTCTVNGEDRSRTRNPEPSWCLKGRA